MITVDVTDELTPAFKNLIGQLEKPEPMWREFGGYLQRRWRNSMRNAQAHSLDSAPAGEPPWRHKGGLQRSIIFSVEGGGLLVGSTFIGGELLHEGGTIHMKDKLLTVATDWKAYGKRARDFVLNFVPASENASAACHGTLRDPSTGKVLFALMEKVDIQPHPWATFLSQDQKELDEMVVRHLSVD